MQSKNVAVIVAHPDDEVLWAGGLILNNPSWRCFIVSLCRKYDTDRAPKFCKSLKILRSGGNMGNLDDGTSQLPTEYRKLKHLILELLPNSHYDIIITHSPKGEYTRHVRHEEIGRAIILLWFEGALSCRELLLFAYDDGSGSHFPQAIPTADIYIELPTLLWDQKYRLITGTYGFGVESWEARVTPKAEAFNKFTNSGAAMRWLNNIYKI